LANLPDMDFLLGYLAAGDVHAFHSGPTHSILFALAGGTGVALLLKVPSLPLWQKTLFFALVIATHVVLDAVTGPVVGAYPSIGVPLAWPFSDARMLQMPFTLFAGVQHDDWSRLVSWHNVRAMAAELLFLVPVLAICLAMYRRRVSAMSRQVRAGQAPLAGAEHLTEP
jgi:membrane-bound metal-dependent hydrolase YbcI (DUF457 family)